MYMSVASEQMGRDFEAVVVLPAVSGEPSQGRKEDWGFSIRRYAWIRLDFVLPAQNLLPVAEDIAMLDHLTGGRACAGFALGYQRRWVDSMAQRHTA